MLPTSYGRDSATGGTSMYYYFSLKYFKQYIFCSFEDSFPIRDEYELNPGTKSREKKNVDETF